MNILTILPKGRTLAEAKVRALTPYGVRVASLPPYSISAFTAMRIAKVLRREGVDIIEVSTLADAMAAISARKLTDAKNMKVVMNVEPNTQAPMGIPTDLREGVDLWIFPSVRLRDAFPGQLKRTEVIDTPAITVDLDQLIKEATIHSPQKPPVVSWIGDITNPQRLKVALDSLDNNPDGFYLRIAGIGDAAKVMPVVRYTRVIQGKEKIAWVGEEYDVIDEIAKCDYVIKSADDLTYIEAAALLTGRPVIEPADITEAIARPYHNPAPEHSPHHPDQYSRRYFSILSNL